MYLQSGGPETVTPLWPPEPDALSYRLPQYRLELRFEPTDFVQVNGAVNRALISRAVELLAPNRRDRVLDLYCGLGNFTLALAQAAGEIVGLELSEGLVRRARANARHNNIRNVAFYQADLASPREWQSWLTRRWDKVLLDPPRSGSPTMMQALGAPGPSRILYVSCNPLSLGRDARILVSQQGFRLTHAGIVDMFPHTSHVEAIALFHAR